MKKYLSAMSGGVDSSVATQLLIDNTSNVVAGVTLSLFDEKLSKTCSVLNDLNDAKDVAKKLNIEHFVLDFSEYFRTYVVNNFIETYRSGNTPNPCVACNKKIKFGYLIDETISLGYDYVATGHYAKIEKDQAGGRYLIKRAKDLNKDQSYVLYSLSQHQLSHAALPLGDLRKDEVRDIAAQFGFITADKTDSQDICFIKDGDYKTFLKDYTGTEEQSGYFIDTNGSVLGTHSGLSNYTIGQRRGIELQANKPIYVTNKDYQSNTITIGDKENLLSKTLVAENINFIPFDGISSSIKVSAKTRYKQTETLALVSQIDTDKIIVEFENPVSAITPGQSVVFYDGDYLIGGGIITNEAL